MPTDRKRKPPGAQNRGKLQGRKRTGRRNARSARFGSAMVIQFLLRGRRRCGRGRGCRSRRGGWSHRGRRRSRSRRCSGRCRSGRSLRCRGSCRCSGSSRSCRSGSRSRRRCWCSRGRCRSRSGWRGRWCGWLFLLCSRCGRCGGGLLNGRRRRRFLRCGGWRVYGHALRAPFADDLSSHHKDEEAQKDHADNRQRIDRVGFLHGRLPFALARLFGTRIIPQTQPSAPL